MIEKGKKKSKFQPYQGGPHAQHDHSEVAPSSETYLQSKFYTHHYYIHITAFFQDKLSKPATER